MEGHEHRAARLTALVEQVARVHLVRDARLNVRRDAPVNVFDGDRVDAELSEQILFDFFRFVDLCLEPVCVGTRVGVLYAECDPRGEICCVVGRELLPTGSRTRTFLTGLL